MAIPNLTNDLQGIDLAGGVEPSPFPAKTKEVAGLVNGVPTDLTSMYFSDKILITISQGGRLAQWVQVPLSSASPTSFDTALPSEDSDMLPMAHITPKTLLGAGGDQRETNGHLYASQIATAIMKRNPEETRTILVGFGLEKVDTKRETFFDLIELVHKVI
ncbi:hypothetical protein GLAREA_01019 [Glarea lozoyensis ATCC 20868]|uniref:Uncharacterized protein n=1 Tax=Glarea lozoyensis (strain ATCC 20868 / MF5171) TaxID=1116229 RepID=S3CY40_GLAL2|nr:uncharacterized protein GLAREA_01019 [Glarea lozoyensis ATCC 20868]EPE29859.1 hypothetical protein GLAREA_01019 [Glarea lozoyensis ATCC 20868]